MIINLNTLITILGRQTVTEKIHEIRDNVVICNERVIT